MLRDTERNRASVISLHNISYQTLYKIRQKCSWTHKIVTHEWERFLIIGEMIAQRLALRLQ